MHEQPTAAAPTVAPPPPSIDLAALLCDDEIGQRSIDELMDSLLVTAIEGGSNYWCTSLRCQGAHPMPAEFGESATYPWYTVALRAGRTMTVKTDDNDRCTLDRESGIQGLTLLLGGKHCHPRIAAQLLSEKACADAEVADCWLQLSTMGEVRYG